MVELWSEIERESVGNFKIFELYRVQRTSPRTGKTFPFVVLEAPQWMNVIPITEEGNVVFVHQYRHGSGTVTMELPAGLVDDTDADPAETARRELMEETGYSAETVIKLATIDPNPAFMHTQLHTYLALGCKKVAETQFDSAEDIVVEEIPLDRVDQLFASGQLRHALTLSAFYHFRLYQQRQNQEQEE